MRCHLLSKLLLKVSVHLKFLKLRVASVKGGNYLADGELDD